jgi:hypothetical protein
MLNVLTRPDAGEEEDWDTCDVVLSIEIDDIRLIDRLRVDYSNLNPSNGPNRRCLDNELTVRVKTMSLLDLEDGLTQLCINDKTSKIDLRDSTLVLRETL